MKRAPELPILGFDTETINGVALLAAAADGRRWAIIDEDALFRMLRELEGRFNLLAWNADYDITALLKWFPANVLEIIGRGIRYVYRDMAFFYVPGKFLKFGRSWILDGLQFYGTGLNAAAEKYLEDRKLDVDAAKITLETIYSEPVMRYCVHDAELAGRLWGRFRDLLPAEIQGVKPISPAYLAYKLNAEAMIRTRPLPSINRAFEPGFRGGRFEVYQRGRFTGAGRGSGRGGVWIYDIRSAYPTEISRLYDLDGSETWHSKRYEPAADYSAYDVEVFIPDKFLSPLAYQRDALIYYPVGYYRGTILKADMERILEFGPRILAGTHVRTKRKRIYDKKVLAMYELKRSGNYAAKILLNSIYGKMIQRTKEWRELIPGRPVSDKAVILDTFEAEGRKWYQVRNDRMVNFVHAGEVTSRVRGRLYDLVRKYPEDVIAVATDSVVSRCRIPELEISAELGAWSEDHADELIMIGSGVYFARTGRRWDAHFRGIHLGSKFPVAEIVDKIFSSRSPVIDFKTIVRRTLLDAARRGSFEEVNAITDEIRYLDLNMDAKRAWLGRWRSGLEVRDKILTSEAIQGIPTL